MTSLPGPVVATAAAVASRRVTAVAAVTEALRRIEAGDGGPDGSALNAVCLVCPEEALVAAQAIDRALADGEHLGPLAGVPVLVKDLEDVAGLPTRKGSRVLADAPPATADGHVPGRLRAAGAVVVGKTTLPEFATEGFTASSLTGVTRNPWDRALSPGGSSGGSAAALSAGFVPVATATDGGGSIRIPSAFCGLVGLKPTRGVVPRRPAPDWIDLSTDGPMATTTADLRLLLTVISGGATGDAEAWPGHGVPPYDGPLTPTRILVAERTSVAGPLPDDVAAAFASATEAFTALWPDAQVVSLDPAGLGLDPGDDWLTLCTAEHVSSLGRSAVEAGLDQMTPAARAFLRYGLRVGIDDYLSARRRRFTLVGALDDLLGGHDVLLTPTVAVASFTAEGRLHPGDPAGPLPSSAYSTELQNLTGHPAISLPAGRCGPLPFGLQVTAPRYADGWLIDLAEAWELAHPWARNAPGFEAFAVG
ncbi:MAG: amidase [Actinomycetota bacterium]|nr:amidase [Actinomycetota bacterium]